MVDTRRRSGAWSMRYLTRPGDTDPDTRRAVKRRAAFHGGRKELPVNAVHLHSGAKPDRDS
jgi:hypothetical protein